VAKHVVATASEIPPGGRKILTVAGRSIGVFNLGGDYYALRNRCPHQGGPLCEGTLWSRLTASVPGEFVYEDGGIVSCGWHGWEFDIKTGQSWCDPARLRVRAYPVHVEAGETLLADPAAPRPGQVKGPYVAETYPVTVDGTYVVVDLPDA
jgi:3-phenylpropionate/trans-cinnamate dioxygenase ferredoxin subunit